MPSTSGSRCPDAGRCARGRYRLRPSPPQPEPFTTIAWRLAHVIVGVLAVRSHHHFGGPPADYRSWPYATDAGPALVQLDDATTTGSPACGRLTDAGLDQPCGPAEGPYAEYSMAELVLHINREMIHHGAEIACIRDLYVHTQLIPESLRSCPPPARIVPALAPPSAMNATRCTLPRLPAGRLRRGGPRAHRRAGPCHPTVSAVHRRADQARHRHAADLDAAGRRRARTSRRPTPAISRSAPGVPGRVRDGSAPDAGRAASTRTPRRTPRRCGWRKPPTWTPRSRCRGIAVVSQGRGGVVGALGVPCM